MNQTEIHAMAQSWDMKQRRKAAELISEGLRTSAMTLDSAFSHYPDTEEAWDDLRRLMYDEDSTVRHNTVQNLAYVYSHVPDKKQAWDSLVQISEEREKDMRSIAYRSLGKISIYKANEADDPAVFKEEFENAIKYYEKSSKEGFFYSGISKFWLRFYKLIYNMIFAEKMDAYELFLLECCMEENHFKMKEIMEVIQNISDAMNEIEKVEHRNQIDAGREVYRKDIMLALESLKNSKESEDEPGRLIMKIIPMIQELLERKLTEIQHDV